MKNLQTIIAEAYKSKIAIGHFNISEVTALKAIFESAKELNVPVIIGVSEGEREFLGAENAVSLVRNLRESYGYPIFLNADHTYSLEKIKEAAMLGFDAVIFDGAKLPFEENIAKTREAVSAAKSINPNILVEGELGYIGQSSAILEKLPEGAQVTEEMLVKVAEAKKFVKETGVDLFAPAVGNLHGMLSSGAMPALNIDRIKEISEAVKIPLVLHGGSGLKDEEFVAAAQNGVAVIHINTEIRLAWRKGLEKALEERPNEVAPYKLLKYSLDSTKEVVLNRLRLFSGM